MNSTLLLLGCLCVVGCSAGGGDDGADPTPGQGGASPSGTSPSPSDPEVPLIAEPAPVARCEPGVYRGAFSGQVSFIGIGIDANGTVELTLSSKEETTTGEFAELSIENGVVTGTAGAGTYRA
ncbi:MAG: hypothetical protein FJ104_16110, partial [Deltaproteobacteria bacterium]|nr:hypothetical protein [Deltaproteobacteria bacterium]